MTAVLERRLLLASTSGNAHFADRGHVPAALADIDAFILGRTDDALLARWFHACLLLEPQPERIYIARGPRSAMPYSAYGLLKLAFSPGPVRGESVPITPRIVRLALAGRTHDALVAAARRLRGSGLSPRTQEGHASPERIRRCAAALLFPISRDDTERLAFRYLRPDVATQTDSPPDSNSQGTPPS